MRPEMPAVIHTRRHQPPVILKRLSQEVGGYAQFLILEMLAAWRECITRKRAREPPASASGQGKARTKP